ncbi:surfactin synthase thioesterase subunit [Variovorax sp. SG517]|uniref:hypothetical protein n=1 Tax=Variovorax sp. SG517 TaxID=2587117 RepID=UPI0017ECBA61|nr:surfactin synthase thioesterase subunit [Variovorax sp. SG517]
MPRLANLPVRSTSPFLDDLPDAELYFLDGRHWLLETHLDEVVALMRDFLGRRHAPPG